MAKSAKRGIAYDLADPADFAALSPGVSWWYNWGTQPDGGAPTDYIAQYQTRTDVFRYAWFTGRVSPDPHFSSLLGASGQLTGLGRLYLTLPYTTAYAGP